MSVQRVVPVTRANPQQTAFSEVATTNPLPTAPQASTARIGYVASPAIQWDDTATPLGISATFTGTSRDLTATTQGTAQASASSYAYEYRASAESDASFTLALEVSTDNTNWVRVKAIASTAVTGGGQYAEVVHAPSFRYIRTIVVNGGVAQTRLRVASIAIG